MKRLTLAALAVVFAGFTAGTAAATTVKDPRVCNVTRPTLAQKQHDCAKAASVLAMRRHLGGPGGVFQGQTACTLRTMTGQRVAAACTAGMKPELVVYVKTQAGWAVTVTP